MATEKQIRQEIIDAKDLFGTWQYVNEVLFDGQMNNSTLSRIATDEDYFPVRKDIVAILCPPKPKPRDDKEAKRTLVIKATVPELHKIQATLSTRERVTKLLGEKNAK